MHTYFVVLSTFMYNIFRSVQTVFIYIYIYIYIYIVRSNC